MTSPVQQLVERYATDHRASWSLGTFGAIAEFMFDKDEPVVVDRARGIAVASARGAIRMEFSSDVRPVAYETISAHADTWNHAIAFCLPEQACAMSQRKVLTELGPDVDAIRPQDRDAILFDLGLGCLQLDACVRTSDSEALAILRSGLGRPMLEPGNPAGPAMARLSPHRVFISRFGRVEVYNPIPAPGGKSPEGPHTHLLPKLLGHGRTHAATNPIPDGWVPCAHLYPPHPQKNQDGRRHDFRSDAHDEFQTLLEEFGIPELIAVKQAIRTAVAEQVGAEAFRAPETRESRIAMRVALRQLAASRQMTLPDWRERFDRIAERAPSEEGHG